MINQKYIVASILTISFCFSADNNIKVGNQAPSFFLTTLDGRKFFLSDELKIGKPILLNFFATWCGPCKKELPDIYALSQTHKNVAFYLVDVSNLEQNGKKLVEKPEDVIALLEKLKINLPVLMDKYGLITEKYGAFLLPKTVIINPGGIVTFEQTGIIDKKDLKLINALQTN
jgi:thiol-disulfide isomerase/thioredoxin